MATGSNPAATATEGAVRSCRHHIAAAELLKRRLEVRDCYVICGLTKAQAHAEESKDIARLLRKGYVLANEQHNPAFLGNVTALVDAVERRAEAGGARTGLQDGLVRNEDLSIPHIPGPRASFNKLRGFALTFDGYDYWGSFEKCCAVADAKDWKTLTSLRTCLFFEQRRWRHSGEQPPNKEELRYWRELVEMIREKVSSGATA